MARPDSDPRTNARVAAVQALFQCEQAGEGAETVIDQFVRHRIGRASFEDGAIPEADVALFARIVRTASLQQDTADALIADHLPAGWPMMRLDPVLRGLLRAASAELWQAHDAVPARSVISDYLDIAHGFFEGDEPGMINAILDRIARKLRPAEFDNV